VLIAIVIIGLVALVALAVLIGLARGGGEVGARVRDTPPRSTDETPR
jgi:hypothetical protein